MTRRLLLLIAVAGLVFLLMPACSGDDTAAGPLRPLGTIMGYVEDVSTDAPISGATVTVTSKPFVTETVATGEVVITTVTDIDGTFFRDDIPNGEIMVEIKAGGYRTPKAQTWALAPGGIGDFLFEMAPGKDPPESFEDTDDQSAWPPGYTGEYKPDD